LTSIRRMLAPRNLQGRLSPTAEGRRSIQRREPSLPGPCLDDSGRTGVRARAARVEAVSFGDGAQAGRP